MSQNKPCAQIKWYISVTLDKMLDSKDISELGYALEVQLEETANVLPLILF